MAQSNDAELAARSGHDERTFDVVEQPHAFRVERMGANEILAREQRELGQIQCERNRGNKRT